MAKPISKLPAKRTQTLAQRADRHDLYQRAVQCVEAEIDFVDATFKSMRKRRAIRLREDFCGTANTSCEWVRRRPMNVAVGVDLDPEPLAWGTAHNLATLKPSQRARIRLDRRNVLDELPDEDARSFDIVLAMNFSYFCFKERATLVHYLRRVRESLTIDGILFMDFYGGPDALRVLKERRTIGRKGSAKSYTYTWDQAEYNSITSHTRCHIHFSMSDGSTLRRAFSYDWRVWTLPEIRDALHDAGFTRSIVYWEGDDKRGGGNGVFTPSEIGEPCPSFISYITAEP